MSPQDEGASASFHYQESTTPIGASAFAETLERLGVGKRFAIAVSGGRDSMALACLCAEYARRGSADIHAFMVDHDLREGSADEALTAQDWCRALGLNTKRLKWIGPKPQTGIQAAARNARYKLLAQAANEAGIDTILTAHTADDQAETVAMRSARAKGGGIPAGMKDATLIAAGPGQPIKLLRPLLGFSRDKTTATAAYHSQGYIDDPSNEDETFERIRVRRKIQGAQAGSDFHRERLLDVATKAGIALRQRREEENASFKSLGGVFTRWGGASISLVQLERAGLHHLSPGLVARLIRAVSGADHAPGDEAVQEVIKRALQDGKAVLGGGLLKRHRGGFWFMREPGAILGRAGVPALSPGNISSDSSVLWDRRFILTAKAHEISVRPLGDEVNLISGPEKALFEGPREALMTLPAVYSGNTLIGVPGVLFSKAEAISARSLVRERFGLDIIRFS